MQETDTKQPADDESWLIRLSKLKKFEVADGDPDVRGWAVLDARERKVGAVYDLIVDPGRMLVRYLDVLLNPDSDVLPEGKRHILVPIGFASLAKYEDQVFLKNLRLEVLLNCPAYQGESITRRYELAVRKAFVSDLLSPGPDFYAGQVFDGSGMFRPRPTSQEPNSSHHDEIS